MGTTFNPDQLGQVAGCAELPVPQTVAGEPQVLVFRITPPPIEKCLEIAGLPLAGRDTSAAAEAEPGTMEWWQTSIDRADHDIKKLLEAGATVEPEICFDAPQPGKVLWRMLHVRNRIALIVAIVRLAGYGPEEGPADAAATFPPEHAGGGAAGKGAGETRGDGVEAP